MITGLTKTQVQEKISQGRVNAIPKNSKTFREIFLTNVFSPFNIFFFVVILILVIFYFRTQEIKLLLDGIGIVSLVFINTIIALIQESRAKVMLDKVQLLVNREIQVMRDSELQKISVEELVEEDVVYIERGDQVPADGKILKNTHVEIDESLLTGESESILKNDGDLVLSGSFVVAGNAYFLAEKLGKDSYAGKVTSLAKNFKFIVSPLQKRIIQIIQILSGIALTLILIKAFDNSSSGVFEVDAIRQYTTIIVSLVPHGLIFLTTITYVVGIYRISKLGGIVQKMNAIEAFSGINVVCMDKTGTLTKNKLSITNIINLCDLDKTEIELVFGTYAKTSSYKNSTLNALNKYESYSDIELIDEIPFNSKNKYSAIKIKIKGKERIFILGAYDVLKKNIPENILSKVDDDKIKYYRNVLFLEAENFSKLEIKDILQKAKTKPLALISLVDTVRKDSKYALELFASKNIDLKVLSGDAVPAIQAIAQKIGWNITDDMTITGPELIDMSSFEFADTVVKKKIFARLAPEQKKTIVETLRSKGLYTAMIGDGVNDLPAIKAANLGIAMEEGSQVTKEIADIILVKNKFSLLPNIFDEGNKIINSVSMAAKLFLSKNFLITFVTLCSVFFSFPFIFTPRKVSFLTIFIITLPAFLISIHNKDISRKENFIKDLISTVLVSSSLMVIVSYSAYFLSQVFFPGLNMETYAQIFICVVVCLAISNFLSVVLPAHADWQSKNLFIFYNFALISGLFLLTVIDLSKTPLFWFGELYEISKLNFTHWIFISIVGLIGGGILYLLQKVRREMLEFLWKK